MQSKPLARVLRIAGLAVLVALPQLYSAWPKAFYEPLMVLLFALVSLLLGLIFYVGFYLFLIDSFSVSRPLRDGSLLFSRRFSINKLLLLLGVQLGFALLLQLLLGLGEIGTYLQNLLPPLQWLVIYWVITHKEISLLKRPVRRRILLGLFLLLAAAACAADWLQSAHLNFLMENQGLPGLAELANAEMLYNFLHGTLYQFLLGASLFLFHPSDK